MALNEIEEIKQRLDIVEIIQQYVTLKKAGANYKGVCPFHDERTPSLMVSQQKQIWKCFGCGKGGDIYKFVGEAEHLEFGDVLRLLATRAGVTLKPKSQAEFQSNTRKERLYRVNAFVAEVFHQLLLHPKLGQSAMSYLNKRGLSLETIKTQKIGFAPSNFNLEKVVAQKGILPADLKLAGNPEKLFNRIMFPIFDVLTHVVGFTGRTLGENEPKYLNSPETAIFTKSRVLYGLNTAKAQISKNDQVILVEGQMDVLSMQQAGVLQTVASSGTAITADQLQILSRYTPNFLLALDNDSAGQLTTKKVLEMLLAKDLNARVVSFAPYKDASELVEKEPKLINEKLTAAQDAFDWLIETVLEKHPKIDFIEEKKAVIKEILPTLKLISDPTRLDYCVNRLSARITVKVESLYAAIGQKAVSQSAAPKIANLHLTAEEQLIAFLLSEPKLLIQFKKQFAEAVFQSQTVSTIAKAMEVMYTEPTLVNNLTTYISEVKKPLDSQLAEKIDAWLLHVTQNWPNSSPELFSELVEEKFGQLSNKNYELAKEKLSKQIRLAQDSGDIVAVKKLMQELTTLTKNKGGSN